MAPKFLKDNNPAVNDLLQVAQDLQVEKDAIQKKQTANRTVLRGYVDMEQVSKAQAEAIAEFYPVPKRREAAASETATAGATA